MKEIWQECASFQTSQVRAIIKKGWFSHLEILEIHQKMNYEQDTNTISDTPRTDKQNQSNQNEPLISENRNATKTNVTQPDNTMQTLTQKQKINLENLKRIMNGGKDELTITKKRRMENSQ